MWNDQIILTMQTFIDDCQLITAPRYCDHRGMFSILFDAQSYQTRFQFTLQQINEVYSSYGVIRGLHAQRSPWAQAKIIQVLEGEIFDVAVDARKNSLQQGKVTQIYLWPALTRTIQSREGNSETHSSPTVIANVIATFFLALFCFRVYCLRKRIFLMYS